MKYRIKLSPADVKSFVAAATRCDCDIDVATNNHNAVDAKSILGVLGLDLTMCLNVTVQGYDEEFESYLRSYAVAC